MKIYQEIPADLPPLGLTFGTFDGVHLGHQSLLRVLKQQSKIAAVLTFTTHPLQVLKGETPRLICTLSERLDLLEKAGADLVIAIPFTLELASLRFDLFLDLFPLTHLILGEGSAFGNKREGTNEKVLVYSARRKISTTYLPKILLDGEPISSRRIRTAIAAKDFRLSSRLLGRPYTPAPEEQYV